MRNKELKEKNGYKFRRLKNSLEQIKKFFKKLINKYSKNVDFAKLDEKYYSKLDLTNILIEN